MKNVLEWLEKTASLYPDKKAYSDVDTFMTFSDVINEAKSVGTALADLKTRTPVAIISGRKAETVSAYLGIVYSGHAYAPIDGTLPDHRIKVILDLLNPEVIVAGDEYYSKVLELSEGVEVLRLSELRKTETDEEILKSKRAEMVKTDPLYVIFTSGSTGKPKGVITSHESLMCYIESYADVMNICEDDVLGNQSPLDYIAAIRDIYLPIYRCASTVIIPKEYFMQPQILFDYMNENSVTAIGWSVSAFTVLEALGAFKGSELEKLRKICFSGSIMPMKCLKTWMENLPDADFVNQYGPTEATASCTYYRVSQKDLERDSLPIGVPYNNYRIHILDENLNPVENGEVGEICVSGPILALGYYGDLERTEKSFILNPGNTMYPERIYRTGDYGRKNSDGILEFCGRMDRQVKHLGHRVELDEIECAAGKISGVSESVCLFDAEKDKLVLFYAGDVDKRTLSLELKDQLPLFMLPRKIKQMDSLPKLPNGKIDMNMLKERL